MTNTVRQGADTNRKEQVVQDTDFANLSREELVEQIERLRLDLRATKQIAAARLLEINRLKDAAVLKTGALA